MRGQVVGSAVVHVALITALFAVRHSRPEIVPGPEVVTVALLDPQSLSLPPLPVVAPKPEERVPDIVPNADEGVRITPPKPKPRPKPVREEPPREPEPQRTQPSLPYAAVGPPGLSGQVSVDAADFEFTYYLMLVRNRIAQVWTPPGGLTGSQSTTVVYFRIARSGSITGARIESPSGVDFFDRTALRAVLISDPLPPLPLGYGGSDLGVHFGFQYSSP